MRAALLEALTTDLVVVDGVDGIVEAVGLAVTELDGATR